MKSYLVTVRVNADTLPDAVNAVVGLLDQSGIPGVGAAWSVTDAKEEEYEVIESPSAPAEPELE